MKKFLSFLVVSVCLICTNSCTKRDFSGSLNLFGGGVGNITFFNYKVNFHRVKVYPGGCKIEVDQYSSIDSISFVKQFTAINIPLPVSDTIYHATAYTNNYYYHQWKITGPNNDSIAGGRSSALKMKDGATIEINY